MIIKKGTRLDSIDILNENQLKRLNDEMGVVLAEELLGIADITNCRRSLRDFLEITSQELNNLIVNLRKSIPEETLRGMYSMPEIKYKTGFILPEDRK